MMEDFYVKGAKRRRTEAKERASRSPARAAKGKAEAQRNMVTGPAGAQPDHCRNIAA